MIAVLSAEVSGRVGSIVSWREVSCRSPWTTRHVSSLEGARPGNLVRCKANLPSSIVEWPSFEVVILESASIPGFIVIASATVHVSRSVAVSKVSASWRLPGVEVSVISSMEVVSLSGRVVVSLPWHIAFSGLSIVVSAGKAIASFVIILISLARVEVSVSVPRFSRVEVPGPGRKVVSSIGVSSGSEFAISTSSTLILPEHNTTFTFCSSKATYQ